MSKRTILIELDSDHVHLTVKDKNGKLLDELEGTGDTIPAIEAAVVAIVLDTYREATK